MIKPLLQILAVLIFMLTLMGGFECHAQATTKQIAKAIHTLVKVAPARKLSRDKAARLSLAADITAAGNKYKIDSYLLVVIFYYESSFKTEVKREAGHTIGLGQVGPVLRGLCREVGISYKTRLGQAQCTAYHLQRYKKQCGNIYSALLAYAGWGKCRTDNKRKHWQVKRRFKLARKLRAGR